METGIFLLGKILNPFALFDHDAAQRAFDQVSCLADGKQRENADAHKPGQNPGQWHTEAPDKAAVKQEGDHGLAAGAEGEICGVGIGIEGECNGIEQDEHGCQLLYRWRCVVNPGEG